MDEFDDLEFDDILDNYGKNKKRKKSKHKGGRGERGCIDQLEKRFPGLPFSRTIGSGNRIPQVKLSEEAIQVFTGDIVCPKNFAFALEVKHGYNNTVKLELAVERFKKTGKETKGLDKFLEQAVRDGKRVNKMPLLCWKRDYKPWLAFVKESDLNTELRAYEDILVYKEWRIVPLSKLLEQPDSYFFKEAV